MRQKKQINFLLITVIFLLMTCAVAFCNGSQEMKSEVISQTENGIALFSDNGATKTNEGKQGDVLSSSGWLYSNIITVGAGYEYKLTATIKVKVNGTQHNSDSNLNGRRVRIYLVPLTNTNADFNLTNAAGTAQVTVIGTNNPDGQHGRTDGGTAYYFTIPSSGETRFQTVFTVNEPTKIRIIVEKGAPDWVNDLNSKMAAMEVAVSNVSLVYN